MELQELKSKTVEEQMEFIYDNYLDPETPFNKVDVLLYIQRYHPVLKSLKEFNRKNSKDINSDKDYRKKILEYMIDFQNNLLNNN